MNKQFLKLIILLVMMIQEVMASSLDIMNDDNRITKSIETNTENSDLIYQEQVCVKLKQIQNANEFQKQTNSEHSYIYQGIGEIPPGTITLFVKGVNYFPFCRIVDPTTIEYIDISNTVKAIMRDFKNFTALKCIKIPMHFYHLHKKNGEQRFIEHFVNTKFCTWNFEVVSDKGYVKLTRGDVKK